MSEQVSAADRELLTCLIEECSEVIHATTKILRHGIHNYNPDSKDLDWLNENQLNKELGDVEAIIDLLMQRELIDDKAMENQHERKLSSLGQYLHHSDIVDGRIIPMRKDS